jgi:hypothetical protein
MRLSSLPRCVEIAVAAARAVAAMVTFGKAVVAADKAVAVECVAVAAAPVVVETAAAVAATTDRPIPDPEDRLDPDRQVVPRHPALPGVR